MSYQFWYNFIFVWLGIMALATSGTGHLHSERVYGERVMRWRKGWAYAAFWPIFYTAVFTIPRYDTYLYLSSYSSLPHSFDALIHNFNLTESANLFVEIEILIRCFFGTSTFYFRLFMGLFHTVPMIRTFRKYSEDFLFTLYLFAAMGCHQGWMMNGIRQFLAVVIIFSATPLMVDKKYFKAGLVILVASRIHTSAVIMLPIMFVATGEAWNKRTLLCLAGCVFLMVLFSRVSGSFDALLEGTEYAGTEASMKAFGDDGMNPIRALVYAVPTIIAFVGRKRIQRENNKLINLCVNMSVANLGVSLIAVVTSGIMVGRLPIYMNLYNFMMMPYIISHTFSKSTANAVRSAAIVFYGIYYLYESGVI